jgi:HK97 family phage major capsid protein
MNQNRGAGEGLQIPAMVLTKTELRAATATGVTGETDAGDFVPTDHMGFIDNLINRMVVFEMGADIMTGLSGNVDIPKKTSDQTATWEGEIDETPESEIGVGKVSLSPKRLSSLGKFSRQLLIQSNPNVERIVRESLTRAIMQKLQATIINGATGGDNFVGILNDSGITNSVTLEGGNPSFSDMVALETAVAADNADLGALAYLTNAKVRGYLKTKALDSGSGRFVWENNEINGYRGFVTNSVPSDLTYGSGTSEISDLSAIIFGNWADLIIGQFGGMNIITDPFTSKKNAMIELQADSFWDIGIKHDESFAVISDAKTS